MHGKRLERDAASRYIYGQLKSVTWELSEAIFSPPSKNMMPYLADRFRAVSFVTGFQENDIVFIEIYIYIYKFDQSKNFI
jgi:hypothetical protein